MPPANVLDAGDENCWTPLMEAAALGNLRAVSLLLKAAANPNVCDGSGFTALILDARFDTVSFSDFSAKWSNFRGLVLGCINADFCKQILILEHFSRSTRFPFLCTPRK